MAITTEKVLKAHMALTSLLKADSENKFVFKTATRFKFAQNLRKTTPVQEDVEKGRNDLILKLGEKDDQGNTSVPAAKVEEFSKALKDLLAVEIDVTFSTIKVDDLGENQIPLDLLAALIEFGIVTE